MLLPRLQYTSRILSRNTHFGTTTRIYTMAPVPSTPTDLRPIIISGPSGVGKGTLYKLLLERHPDTFATSISHTTRDPRPGETRDVDYYYTDMATFEHMIESGSFVEHAKFGGNRYGTSKKMIGEITAGGKIVVLDIEMEGVKQIKSSHLSARYVFIAPPSMSILESRLRKRGTEKEESIQKRLAQAKKEIEYSQVEGVHDLIIVNDDLEEAYKRLEVFVFKPEGEGKGRVEGGECAGLSEDARGAGVNLSLGS